MADIDSRLYKSAATPIGVTTGPIRGSRKIHVATQTGSRIRLPMREIDLDPHSGQPPVCVHDTAGPSHDHNAPTAIPPALPVHRPGWTPPPSPRPDTIQRDATTQDKKRNKSEK